MAEIPAWRRYLRLLGPDWRADNADEIAFHLETRVDELVASGMEPRVAREAAEREFGDVKRVSRELAVIGRRRSRRTRRTEVVADLASDARHAGRGLVRQPVYAVAVILTLSLVIGATTTMFSLVEGILLRPLPYPETDRLVVVWERNLPRARGENVVSVPNYETWLERSRSFQSLAALVPDGATLRIDGAERLAGAAVSASWFDVVGVPTALGRGFTDNEERDQARVVVLSNELWTSAFGARAEIVGESVELSGQPHTVVGVMPPGFDPPAYGWLGPDQRYWVPFTPTTENRQWGRALLVLGRLEPGVTVDDADRELKQIAAARAAETGVGSDWTVDAVTLHAQVTGPTGQALVVLFGAAVLLFGLGVLNVLNLVLARAGRRDGEFAIRAAIGAGRSRLVRQLLAEGLTIGILAAPLGMLLAYGGVAVLAATFPRDTPRLDLIAVNGQTLALCLLATTIGAVVIGLAPAVRVLGLGPSTRRNLGNRLRAASGRQSWSSRAGAPLVVVQVAFALVLAIGASLAVRSFINLRSVPLGFEGSVIAARVAAQPDLEDPALVAFYSALEERFGAVPGVESAGLIDRRPLGGLSSATGVWLVGDTPDGTEAIADLRTITPAAFETIGIGVVTGEIPDMNAPPGPRRPVVINRTMARLLWGTEEVIGRPVVISLDTPDTAIVAAVVEDVHLIGPQEPVRSTVYSLYSHAPTSPMDVLARTALPAETAIPMLRQALWDVDSSLPLYEVNTLASAASESTAQERINSVLLGGFSALAVLLATIGIYGVLTLQVHARQREIAVRLALGSSADRIRWRVLRMALRLAAVGVILGLIGSAVLTRFMRSVLYGVSATDGPTYAAVSVLLVAIAMIAAIGPVRRATRVAPMQILRDA